MLAVRFHGRGGQGAVIASKLLAAAMFREGRQVQAFPSFGAERTGAPVTAFLRADLRPITIHYQVYEPDHVVVLDPVLLKTADVTAGLRDGGCILINAAQPPDAPEIVAAIGGSQVARRFSLATCDATTIALAHGLGSRTVPIVNTAMAGAFASCTGLVTLESLIASIAGLVPINIEGNQSAARHAFHACRMTRIPQPVSGTGGNPWQKPSGHPATR